MSEQIVIYLCLCTPTSAFLALVLLLSEEYLLGHPHQQLVHIVLQDSRGFYELGIKGGRLVFSL